jgi:type II secretory pathway predicted ATPase ExeA
MASKDGFVVITGEVGAGKTTLMRQLLSELEGEVIVVHIEQTQLSTTELLQLVTQELLGEAPEVGKIELLRRLRECLLQAWSQDLRVVIAVDEAQSLSQEVMEEIRLLSGIESNKEKLLGVVLMGQPGLVDLLDATNMEQLRQRIRLRFHLSGLSVEETRAYIEHRLSVAGAPDPGALLTDDAMAPIMEFTGGIPRLINTLCDMALLTAYVDGDAEVGSDTVRSAAQELEWPTYAERLSRSERPGHVIESVESDAAGVQLAGLGDRIERLEGALQAIETQLGRIAGAMESREVTEKPARRQASTKASRR